MLTRETMGGIYAIPPTPFNKNGEFDEENFRQNVRTLCEIGARGVVTTGSVGEFHTIRWEDHQRLIEALVAETRGKPTISIAGCSGVNTDEAIKKAKFAEECGADAVMNVSPYYVRLTPRELVKFWRDLAEACPSIGIIVYNNPGTAQIHDVEIFRELAKIPSMCGSKEAHHDFGLWYRLHYEGKLAHMTATELTWFVPTMKLGSKGIFSMSAAMCPGYILKLYESCRNNDWEQATRMQFRLHDVWRTLDSLDMLAGYHALARFKAYVNAFGFLSCGITRKPFIPVPDDIQKRLTDYVQKEFNDLINC